MKMRMTETLRIASVLLAVLLILPLSSCFSGRGSLFGDITNDIDGKISSEYDTTVELSNGIVLTLSMDGIYYSVTDGAECTSTAASIPSAFNGIPVREIRSFGENEIIKNLFIPESITKIGNYAFSFCPNLQYTEYGNAKYLGSGDNEYFALISAVNAKITDVDIHRDTLIIADYAFINCGELTKAVIPDRVKSIGELAFQECDKLAEVVFGKSVETIGYSAFAYLDSLRYVRIPDSVTDLGRTSFFKCTALESVVLGDGIEEVPYQVFQNCTALTEVKFGNSVRTLAEYAFAGCTSLKDIRLPSTVDTVYLRTFDSCTSLNYSYYGKELRYLPGDESDYEFLVSYVYDSFEKATLHPDTRVISMQAFGRLQNLKELSMDGDGKYLTVVGNCIIDKESKTLIAGINTSVMPNDGSIEAIGDYAFCGMKEFSMTAIPAGVKTIGNYAFSGCQTLESVTLNPELERLGNNAFSHCGLTAVTFGDRIESIGRYAFNYNSITSLYLPSSLRELNEGAFQMSEKLVSVEIAEGLTELGAVAFGSCPLLSNVILPKTLVNICQSAFIRCTSLESIVLPEGLKRISKLAFRGTALKEVTLPESLEIIEEEAFACPTLISIKINRRIADIGRDALRCKSLESVSYGGTAAEWQNFTEGVYDMFNEGDTVTVSCSDGDIECLGVMNIPSDIWG